MEVLTNSFWKDLSHGGAEARNAPLHVKGSVYESGDQKFFIWIISTFGAQIHHLDVFGVADSLSRASARSFLQYPVPCLESFKLQIGRIMPSGDRKFSLFSNNVPSLRSYFHTGIHFDVETSLAFQLMQFIPLFTHCPLVNRSKFCLGLLAWNSRRSNAMFWTIQGREVPPSWPCDNHLLQGNRHLRPTFAASTFTG